MADMLEAAERLWHGGASTAVGQSHPVTHDLGLAEVADRTAFNAAFGNLAAFPTDEALPLIDTRHDILPATNPQPPRAWCPDRPRPLVYTHRHIAPASGPRPSKH